MNKKHFYAAVILLLFLAVGIQPAIATKYIPGDTTIGTWDDEPTSPTYRTFTLTTDVYEGLVITESNLTLDGAGHTITGLDSNGISLANRRFVTVKNLTVEGFVVGIHLNNYRQSDYIDLHLRDGHNIIENNTINSNGTGINIGSSNWNTVTNNNVSTCDNGIWLAGSRNNTVTNNTVEFSSNKGISLNRGQQGSVWISSDNTTLTGNSVSGCNAGQYSTGIYLNLTYGSNLTNNTVSDNSYGIRLYLSYSNLEPDQGNTLTNNTVLDNTTYGIELYSTYYNTLTSNTVSGNGHGIHIYGFGPPDKPGNTLTNNNASNNDFGIRLHTAKSNTLIGNSVVSNTIGGIYLTNSDDNTVENNTISNNGFGIKLNPSDYNKIYNNNFKNTTNASVIGVDNVFDLGDPETGGKGGNYWSNWTTPDADGDGIVDNPYVMPPNDLGQDNFPWVVENGWLIPVNQPPVADAGPDQIVEQDIFAGASVTLDGSGSSDDGQIQPLTYTWTWAGGGSPTGVNPTVTLPLGTTEVTLTVSDGQLSDTDTVHITVQSAESPAAAVEYIRDYIEQMDVPEDAEKEMGKAVKELNKAIDEFNNDRIDKALNKIEAAVKQLMKAQQKGADTQGVIGRLVALVKGIADKAIEDAIDTVGADNLHVVKAQEHYDKARDEKLAGKYDRAIKEFKKAYREAMKALGE